MFMANVLSIVMMTLWHILLLCLQMSFVHAGTLLGESEELIDGYVIENDENGIQASRGAENGESDISEYFVGIGTSEGKDTCICSYALD